MLEFGYFKVPITADYPPYERIARSAVSVNLYPNPASESISIVLTESASKEFTNFKVKITNLDGRLCYSSDGFKKLEVDISTFSQGIYLVTIEFNDDTFVTKKLIKQ